MKQRIEDALEQAFAPQYLSVENDSHKHVGDHQSSHFKVLLVSKRFTDLNAVQRHRSVYKVLHEIMQEIHALQLNTWTPEEWQKKVTAGAHHVRSSQCAKSPTQ